jgi:hypothetical protein
MPRFSSLVTLLLLLLAVAPSSSRRGGGAGDSDGNSDGGGSGGSGSGSTGSGANTCWGQPPTVIQKEDIYRRPGSYDNGSLTVSHRFSSSSGCRGYCNNDELGTKSYNYDAVLMAGPTWNSSGTNPVFSSLRAFQPRYTTFALQGVQERGLVREMVRIESGVNETIYTGSETIERFKVCWDVQANPSATSQEQREGSNATVEVVSQWDLTTQYTQGPNG